LSDDVWAEIVREAEAAIAGEPVLAAFLTATILGQPTVFAALSFYLSGKIETAFLSQETLCAVFLEATERSGEIRRSVVDDLFAIRERDPASRNFLGPFLNFKGYHALETYRVTHWLWEAGRCDLALVMQSLASRTYGVDIHPGARIGNRVFIDHATGIVIGETAVVGDDVSMLHAVTLGGTGKETGDRHPKIGNGVLLGAGAKVLGNIRVGDGAKVGAGSVVLADVPPHTTVAGIPAVAVGHPRSDFPSLEMEQGLEK
jgi:serine O-acetyltransferase